MRMKSPRSHSIASTMSNNTRPKSRQSTTSLASNSTQPAQQPHAVDNPFSVHSHVPPAVWSQHAEAIAQQMSQTQQFPGGKSFAVPAAVPAQMTAAQAMPQFRPGSSFGEVVNGQAQQPGSFTPVEGRETPTMDISMEDQASFQGDNGAEPAKPRRGAASTQANDNELRRLLRENQGRNLQEIAKQINKDESGSKQEKDKQVFGMLWLQKHVKKSENHSVPRNTVYNEYQYCCGDLRVQTLNPASFGKLVRIIFPNIVTRRLGVRGNSKYHYVDLALVADESKKDLSTRLRAPSIVNEVSIQGDAKRVASKPPPQLPADNTVFSHAGTPAPQPYHNGRHSAPALYYQQPPPSTLQNFQVNESSMLPRPLKFPRALDRLDQRDVQFELPDITHYLPKGTDVDASNSLCSVYRSHCVLAIDNFRYCKTEKLCDNFKNLHGLLTVPGQKLLASPSIAAWVRECDWRKYQSMIPMLNMILLTQVPQKAMNHMQNVAVSLCNWIRHFYQNQPQHVLVAMLGPAGIFVNVLERFCRVQGAALELAPIFDNVDKRNHLWSDWVRMVNPLQVVQSALPAMGHRRCRHILTREFVLLLNPTQSLPLAGTLFEDDGEGMTDFRAAEMGRECKTSSDLIARMYRFLLSLQSRFPHASSQEILNSLERFTGNAARNLTLAGALTVAEWWRIKVFIDEAGSWLAEMGGLFENSSDILIPSSQFDRELGNIGSFYDFDALDPVSRPATAHNQHSGTTFNTPEPGLSHAHPKTSREPSLVQQQTESTDSTKSVQQAPNVQKPPEVHEDSGIGLGIHDDFNMETKYNSFIEGVNGSDPADIVVC